MKKKETPRRLPCKCGGRGTCVQFKGEGWKVVCLNLNCSVAVRGFATAEEANEAWNEEVAKK